jgi:hypothetical protein
MSRPIGAVLGAGLAALSLATEAAGATRAAPAARAGHSRAVSKKR